MQKECERFLPAGAQFANALFLVGDFGDDVGRFERRKLLVVLARSLGLGSGGGAWKLPLRRFGTGRPAIGGFSV